MRQQRVCRTLVLTISAFNLTRYFRRLRTLRSSSEKAREIYSRGLSLIIRRLPTLPHSYPRSTIGSNRLNFRVRDGNGCDPVDKITGKLESDKSDVNRS